MTERQTVATAWSLLGYRYRSRHSSADRPRPRFGSALRRKNDAEQHPFVRAFLHGSADMSTPIRRDHIVDLVIGNRCPFAVHLHFVMLADHTALRRRTFTE